MSEERNQTGKNLYSLDTSLLDYEDSEGDQISVWGDNVDTFLNDEMATRTPSFENNGKVVSTPKSNKNTDMEVDNDKDRMGVRKDVEEAMGYFGQGLLKVKEVATKLGIPVPPTPRALPSPMRIASSGTFRAPTPFSVPYLGRLTPGAPVISWTGTAPHGASVNTRSGSAMHGIVQTPPTRGTKATVIRRTPGTPSPASTPARTSTTPPASTSANTAPSLPTNNRSDMVVLTAEEFQKMKAEADKYQQLQQQGQRRTDVRSRLGWKGEEGRGVQQDEFRRLGALCRRCGEDHQGGRCMSNFGDLYCEYPPCIQKTGHTVKVCHELMKRCRFSDCNNQRGHRTDCHFRPENRQAYGTGWAAAEELKLDYDTYKHMLTEEEREVIRKYEEEERGGSRRHSRWDRPY